MARTTPQPVWSANIRKLAKGKDHNLHKPYDKGYGSAASKCVVI